MAQESAAIECCGPETSTTEYAKYMDAREPLRHLREEFLIPSREDLKRTRLGKNDVGSLDVLQPCTYLCGNSLGLQPRRTAEYIQNYLETWAQKGVYGHFRHLEDSMTSPWVDIDDTAKEEMAKIVGAMPSEVAIMETLTANLHLLMASFYQPTKQRYRIIIEGKAFPSDHYAVQSQLVHHSINPRDGLVEINPPSDDSPYLPTSHILSTIDRYADSTALILLPGIQYYSGQFFDIRTITSYAQSKGIIVGWDLAHATGNVPLNLHDWNVDFAAWCNYKYMNCGPGAIGGLFIHERHGRVEMSTATLDSLEPSRMGYRPRLSGWWGSNKNTRFRMEPSFTPIPGAAGFQLSNPSVLDITAVLASLSVFSQTNMAVLRERSLLLTGYLEKLLLDYQGVGTAPYSIITPSNPEERGAQLSLRLEPSILERVMEVLEGEGVVVDERRPDVIRVAPTPLYNNFMDCKRFATIFQRACHVATSLKDQKPEAA